jgi:hypothetical protein
MAVPSRLSQGLATQFKGTVCGDYPLPSPFRTSSTPATYYQTGLCVASYSSDFFNVDTGWGTASTGTFATTDAVGGVAVLTPGTTGTYAAAYKGSAGYQFIAGQKFWYQTSFDVSSISSATQVINIGLQTSSGGTLGTTDSLFFQKPAGSTSLNLVSTVGGTTTTLLSGITTLTSATFINVGLYYNNNDLLVFLNDSVVARVSSPSIGSSGTTLTSALLTPVFSITPVALETISTDYLLVAEELAR